MTKISKLVKYPHMAIVLRPYQEKAKSDIYKAWDNGHKNVLLVLPTGMGKTKTFCSIAIDRAVKASNDKKMSTAILVHRKELLSQISLTLAEEEIPHNIIAPKNVILGIVAAQRQLLKKQFYDYSANVTVISVDTLNARIMKHEKWAKSIRLWITDEAAHLLKANKWGRAVKYFTGAVGLGVTATPERLDKRGLGSHVDGVFDKMVEGPITRWGIEEGFLSKYKIVIPESDYRLHLKESAGDADYTKEAMAVASQKSRIVGDVIKNYQKFSLGKQAIVFASDIAAGERMESKFKEAGIKAKLLTGLTRDEIRLKSMFEYRRKEIQVLINVDLFDEGLDCLKTDTEILTPNGWQNYQSIKNEVDCYAWSPITEKVKIVPILRSFVRQTRPCEKFVNIESQHTDISVTENHNIYYRKKDYYTKSFREKNHSISKAKDILKYEKPWSLPISAEAEFKGLSLTNDEIEFIGWALTDSHLSNRKELSLYQSKPKYVKEIKAILKRLSFTYSEQIIKKENIVGYGATMDFHKFYIHKAGFKYLLKYCDKNNLNNDMHEMTREQFKLLWDTMMKANGSKNGNKNGKLCTTRKNHVDFFMHMAVIRGYGVMHGNYFTKTNNLLVYDMGIKDKNYIQLTKRDARGARFSTSESRGEKVWCVTNKLGTLITRRNGKVAILGNCPGIEAVFMARPTKSLSKYLQMAGRGLRPAKDKPYMVLVDHVGNVKEHGLPDNRRKWSLDRPTKRKKKVNLIRLCKNVDCNAPFDRFLTTCPYCGFEDPPRAPGTGSGRVSPAMVDGDLVMLDPDTLRELHQNTVLEDPGRLADRVLKAAGQPAAVRAMRNQTERIATQKKLAETIATWAGVMRTAHSLTDRQIHKEFFIKHDQTMCEVLSRPRVDMLEIIRDLEGDI